MRLGYIRVSSEGQNTDRQLDGLKLDKVFEEKVSGKDTNRPKLQELLNSVRKGDEVIVHSMDRLARNLIDLHGIIEEVTTKKASIRFIKEGQEFTGEKEPMKELMLNIMGSVAQFERDIIKERQREGIAKAKERGVYKGRRPKFSHEELVSMKKLKADGSSVARVAKLYKTSRATVYRCLG
jgi:DNA invertase Pin-like site-specific DNA recombinase